MAEDLLKLEHMLLSGTLIMIDGGEANASFLWTHFYRNWESDWSQMDAYTLAGLQEPAFGKINAKVLAWCIGPPSKD